MTFLGHVSSIFLNLSKMIDFGKSLAQGTGDINAPFALPTLLIAKIKIIFIRTILERRLVKL